jgi:ferredoxin-NADP reductase
LFVTNKKWCPVHVTGTGLYPHPASTMVDMTIVTQPAARTRGIGRLVRSVAQAAVTPLDLDDLLDHFHPLRRGAELSARVLEVVPETAQSATLVLKPGRDWAGHVPGQYVRVGVDVDGTRLWRTYSLTHGPRADGSISITVKAIEGGTVSNHLVHRTAPGTLLRLAQADGDFVLPQPLPAKLLLVTAGSGITPVIGMLRNLFSKAQPPATDIVLIHSALSRAEVIFAEEIRSYAARGLIRLVELHTDTHGLLDVDSLDELVPDLADRPTYACGPAGLLDALEAHHEARGLALHTERFRPVVLAEAGEGGTVAFASGPTIDVDGATPILDAAESAGVLMPSGCRMGICMGCVLPLKEGAVRDLRNGALTVAVPGETDPGGVPIQTCVSAPAGACSVDH